MTNGLIEQLDNGTHIYKFVDGEQGAKVLMTKRTAGDGPLHNKKK